MVSVEKPIPVLEGVANFPKITFPVVFISDQGPRFVFEWMMEDEFADTSLLVDDLEACAAARDNLLQGAGIASEGQAVPTLVADAFDQIFSRPLIQRAEMVGKPVLAANFKMAVRTVKDSAINKLSNWSLLWQRREKRVAGAAIVKQDGTVSF